MNISDLIKELEQFKKIHGDLKVCVCGESERHAIELAKRAQVDVLNDATIKYEYDYENIKLILEDKQHENSN